MTHPNVDLLRGFLDAYGANDRDAVGRSLAEEDFWHVGGTHPFSGNYRGRDAILGYFDRVGSETGGTLRLEPIELMASDERGAVFLRVTGEREGKRLDVTMAEAFEFDAEGRIREFWAHATDQDAIDAFWG